MTSPDLVLRPLKVRDESSFKDALAEFARESPPWQFAFLFDHSRPFSEYVLTLDGHARGIGVPSTFVPNTFLVGVVGEVVVGRVSIRHTLNAALARVGGHVGYGVIPSMRNRGFATAMLRQAIPMCAALGISQALITCDVGNIASRKVIETCGGVFESIVDCPDSGIPKMRYWLPTMARPDVATARQSRPV